MKVKGFSLVGRRLIKVEKNVKKLISIIMIHWIVIFYCNISLQ